MITRLEVRNFRMLRANAVSLGRFVVLVGRNATGKSTLLGALRFVSELVRGGVPLALSNAVEREAPNFGEFCFDPAQAIEFAVELGINGRPMRDEVRVGLDAAGTVAIQDEHLFLLPGSTDTGANDTDAQQSLWDDVHPVHSSVPAGWRTVVKKTAKEGNDCSQQVRDYLRDGVIHLKLDGGNLRRPSLPGSSTRLLPDGSNLARVALSLRERDPVLFDQWVSHVGSAAEGLEAIDFCERPEDRKTVLLARFAGHRADSVPSWLLSDGTLRLLALSLLSYASGEPASVAMVEQPENGLHPLAMQAVYSALSQPAEDGQVLVVTHSPAFLAQVSIEQALVFSRLADGSAMIRRGTEVPGLRECSRAASLADLFSMGVLDAPLRSDAA